MLNLNLIQSRFLKFFKIVLLLLFATLLFYLASCATLFNSNSQKLSIGSTPDGADIYVNGIKQGKTPHELNLKADKSYTIQFRKSGHNSVTRVVNTRVGAG